MKCREVLEYLPAYLDEAEGPRAQAVAGHLRTCKSCSAELKSYREQAAALQSLVTYTHEPPGWLLGAATEAVRERAERLAALRERRRRLAEPRVVATAGAVVAAGVAGALLFRGARRRRFTLRRLRAALARA